METKELKNRKCLFLAKYSHYYAMIDGELTQCKIDKIKYFVDDDIEQVTVILPNGDKKELEKGTPFYHSPDAFELGEKAERSTQIEFIIPLSYWVVKNGEPNFITPNIKTIEYIGRELLSFNGGEQLPNEWYESREECLKWNDYTIVEADGEKRTRESKHRKLLLTDKQRKLVDKLRETFEELRREKVEIYLDVNDYTFKAFNSENIKKHKFNYETCDDDFVLCYDDINKHFTTDIDESVFFVPCGDDSLIIEWNED